MPPRYGVRETTVPLLQLLLPSVPPYVVIVAGTLLEAPLCVFGTFRSLSAFTFAGCASTVAVMLLVAALPVLDPGKECLEEEVEHVWMAQQIIPAVGIIALSVAGHSCFPSVRAAMAQPSDFPKALNTAYTASAVILSTIASIGYWYWGSEAHTLVTADFEAHSPYARFTFAGGFGIHKVVDGLVLLNTATTLPLFVMGMRDIVGNSLLVNAQGGQVTMRPIVSAALRLSIFAAVAFVSFTARTFLGVVESVVGAVCALQCSLLLPTAFYVALKLKTGSMTPARWLLTGCMFLFGSCLVLLILAQAANGFFTSLLLRATGYQGGLASGAWSQFQGTSREWLREDA